MCHMSGRWLAASARQVFVTSITCKWTILGRCRCYCLSKEFECASKDRYEEALFLYGNTIALSKLMLLSTIRDPHVHKISDFFFFFNEHSSATMNSDCLLLARPLEHVEVMFSFRRTHFERPTCRLEWPMLARAVSKLPQLVRLLVGTWVGCRLPLHSGEMFANSAL